MLSVVAVNALFLAVGSTAQLLPARTLGFYCLIADDTVTGYTSTDNWQPELYDYLLQGSNVIWLTFINPQTMDVPAAMANLAQCRGEDGCPTKDQKVIFSVGGYSYSMRYWPFLQSRSAAQEMAQEVATWNEKYGADGIDLDIEGTAGNQEAAAQNIVIFAQELKKLNPDFIITQPVYGYPQIAAENAMVNNGWDSNSNPTGIVDSIGIMVYSDLQSLQWVPDYANATNEWEGFPITVDVPTTAIMAGIQGSATSSITQMADAVVDEDLGGMMVWFASVYDKTRDQAAFSYGYDDSSPHADETGDDWAAALAILEAN